MQFDCALIVSFILVSFQEELKQVKKRNKQLCFILAQGESEFSLHESLRKNKFMLMDNFTSPDTPWGREFRGVLEPILCDKFVLEIC